MPEIGEFLGDMSDQIAKDYGPEAFINKFTSGDPKNYAYNVVNPNCSKYHSWSERRPQLQLCQTSRKEIQKWQHATLCHSSPTLITCEQVSWSLDRCFRWKKYVVVSDKRVFNLKTVSKWYHLVIKPFNIYKIIWNLVYLLKFSWTKGPNQQSRVNQVP